MIRFLLPLLLATFPATSHADSFLGLTAAQFTLAYQPETEASDALSEATLTMDFAITGHHGLQTELQAATAYDSWLGRIGGHLYMRPNDTAKYGVFAQFSDLDHYNQSMIELGAEGMFTLNDTFATTLTAGLGVTLPGSFDYLFAGVALQGDLTDTLSITGSLDIQEFDEEEFYALASQTAVELSYRPTSSGTRYSLTATYDRLSGASGGQDNLQLGAMISLELGTPSGLDRPFRTVSPTRSLVSRGIRF